MRRADSVAFMGGAHVFPGGSVDPGDRLADPHATCDGVDAAIARMPDVDAGTAIAYHAAAIRELHEEAGVLLARGPHGAQRLALDALAFFAHWVTPDIEIKRFDARFFAAIVPEGQEAVHDDREASGGGWFDPADAVSRCRAGEVALPPPTWTTLRTLERFSSVDEVMAWARARIVTRVQPGFLERGGETMLTLPGDPLHPEAADGDVPKETRFVLDQGRWRAIGSGDPRS